MKCKNCGGYLSEEYSHHKKVKKKYCTQECGWRHRMRLKKAHRRVRNRKVVPRYQNENGSDRGAKMN